MVFRSERFLLIRSGTLASVSDGGALRGSVRVLLSPELYLLRLFWFFRFVFVFVSFAALVRACMGVAVLVCLQVCGNDVNRIVRASLVA